MFEIVGWAEILATPIGDEGRRRTDDLIRAVNRQVAEHGLRDGIQLIRRGGSALLVITVVQNRDRGDLERCKRLLAAIGAEASGTYGVFYIRDDEVSNVFSRLVIRRGRIEDLADDLFSPIIPTIEDP